MSGAAEGDGQCRVPLEYCVDLRDRADAEAERSEASVRLRQLAGQLEAEQRLRLLEAERLRIAQELYDHAEQTFFAIGLLASATLSHARAATRPPVMTDALTRISELATAGTRHLREARTTLTGADEADREVIPALRQLVIVFQLRTGIDADLLLTGRPRRVPADVAEAIDATARTALACVEAISASAVVLRLKVESRTICLTIHDDGDSGRTPPRTRIVDPGLRQLAQHVRRLGGTFSARTAPEGGLLVRTRLPLNRA